MPARNRKLKRFLKQLYVNTAIFIFFAELVFLFSIITGYVDKLLMTFPFSAFYADIIPGAIDDATSLESYRIIYPIFLIINILSTGIGSLIVARGRTLEEALMILIVAMIPRRRKLSGRVFDLKTGESIAFASVDIIEKNKEGKFIPVARALTDLDGRYRFNIEDKSKFLFVKVNFEPYEEYIKPLTNVYKNNVIQDIPLERKSGTTDKLRSFYYFKLKPIVYIYYTYYLLGLSVITWLGIMLGIYLNGPTLFLIVLGLLLGISVIHNVLTVINRLSFSTGKVLEYGTLNPIHNATISIFDKDNQVQVVYSNRNGVVRTNLEDGFYSVIVTKKNYKFVNSSGDQIKTDYVYINKDGYLPKDLYLNKSDQFDSQAEQGLDNPFGN